jgi:hypothetical protein
MARGHGTMRHMGFEKEPPAVYGGKGSGGPQPPMHSHSARPKRHMKGGHKRGRKR